MVTLKWGLANSDNWISAYLMGKLNPYNLVRLIHSLVYETRRSTLLFHFVWVPAKFLSVKW